MGLPILKARKRLQIRSGNEQHRTAEFDEADRFGAFLGFQWAWRCNERRNAGTLIYLKDASPFAQENSESNTLKKIYKSHTPKEILSIPTFTMAKGHGFNFKEFDPDKFERVVEIYNAWGSSEFTKKEGNTCPIRSKDKNGYKKMPRDLSRRHF